MVKQYCLQYKISYLLNNIPKSEQQKHLDMVLKFIRQSPEAVNAFTGNLKHYFLT